LVCKGNPLFVILYREIRGSYIFDYPPTRFASGSANS
jgi:hypothetical protein